MAVDWVNLVHLRIHRDLKSVLGVICGSTCPPRALLLLFLRRFPWRARSRRCLTRDTRRATVRDMYELPATSLLRHAVVDVVALALELDDVTLVQRDHIRIGERIVAEFALWRDEVLHVVILLKLLLRDQVVVVEQRRLDERMVRVCGGVSQPGDLLFGLAEVAREVEVHRDVRDYTVGVRLLATDNGVAPVHERDLFVVIEGYCILLLDEDVAGEHGLLLAHLRVLFMFRQRLHLRCGRTAFDSDLYPARIKHISLRTRPDVARTNVHPVFADRPEAGGDWVDDLLVQCPERVPLE